MTTPRHLLLDGDGVVQDLPGGWVGALRPFLGDRAEAFLAELAVDEQPCLVGDGAFLPVLEAHLARSGVARSAQQVHAAVWEHIELHQDTLLLVAQLRAAGAGVHLVTNQNPERAAFMRRTLGLDEAFDRCFFSHELGAAKPGVDFFAAVLGALGSSPREALLVDDSPRNVAAAREVGLLAEHWHHDDGVPALRSRLAAHGLPA